jgi:hypothetical protein
MPTPLRVVAVLAAATFLTTAWQIAGFARVGNLSTLLTAGALGWFTAFGWLVTLIAGPIAAIQLWRLRASGRLAGVALFGFGVAYYLLGSAALRAPEAPWQPIFAALLYFAVPLCVLVLPQAKAALISSTRGSA